MDNQKKIAIIHPEITGGGSESVLAWTLEALKEKYEITIISIDKLDVNFINAFYMTQLNSNDFKLLRVFRFMSFFPKKFYLLKRHLIAFYCKKNIKKYDLFFSTQNELDFGVAGIQYIHFPVHRSQFINDLTAPLQQENFFFQRIYIKVIDTILPLYTAGIQKNRSIVNSAWTGDVVHQVYGLASDVIFPPVLSDSIPQPFESRKKGFVCIGWIRPEKELEKIITIISKSRQNSYTDLTLEIIGPTWDKVYAEKIKAIAMRKGNWISFHGELNRKDLVELISKYRFGVHGFKNEHFGIAVAEMVKAGCIVFVPNGGGQREIINYDQRLIYSTIEDAVEKITHVMESQELQHQISNKMCIIGKQFSPLVFMQKIQQTVNEVIDQQFVN